MILRFQVVIFVDINMANACKSCKYWIDDGPFHPFHPIKSSVALWDRNFFFGHVHRVPIVCLNYIDVTQPHTETET